MTRGWQRRNVYVPWLMPVKMTLVYAQPDESLAAGVERRACCSIAGNEQGTGQ